MDITNLISVSNFAQSQIANALLQFVRENGEDAGSYEIEEFGLSEGDDDGKEVTKVYNFFDNGGCYFFEPDSLNSDTCENIDDKNWNDVLYSGVTHTAYQCLYIVKDSDGNEVLKYYRFTNGGINWDDDQADPDHGFVCHLNLIDLYYLIEAIHHIEIESAK